MLSIEIVSFLLYYSPHKTLAAIDLLFDSNVFQSFTCNGKFVSSQLKSFINHFQGVTNFFTGTIAKK